MDAPKRAVWNAHVAVSLQENDEVRKHRDAQPLPYVRANAEKKREKN